MGSFGGGSPRATSGRAHLSARRIGAALIVSAAAAAGLAGAAASPSAADPLPSGIVIDGHARFEVLSPTMIRLEYAGDDQFQDGPTFNVVNRTLGQTSYTTSVVNGVRIIQTSKATLQYVEGSGPFTAQNTTLNLTVAGQPVSANPTWEIAPGACPFNTACEGEKGILRGGYSVDRDNAGFTGTGYADDFSQVTASDSFAVTNVPAAGPYALQVRYENTNTNARTETVSVNGVTGAALSFPRSTTWTTVSFPVTLAAGSNTVGLTCVTAATCAILLDSVALTPTGATYPTAAPVAPAPPNAANPLTGWVRGLDQYTDQSGVGIQQVQLYPGLINQAGWYLLDDTYTALGSTATGVTARPSHGSQPYQDGYLFAYGHDYKQGLADLRSLTGPADMLDESYFGVWYSRYFAHTASDYENTILPMFRSEQVPIDQLVVDTDWKVPNTWDGWEFNPALFPDPQSFIDWTKSQGLNLVLNLHEGIATADPKFAATQAIANGKLQPAAQAIGCATNACYRFNWGDPDQLKAWFSLHVPFEQMGVRQWWLDYCCTDSVVDIDGVSADSFINDQYRARGVSLGQRGVALARIGSSFEDYKGDPDEGAWGEHRSTIHFTGDTQGNFATLAFEAYMTAAEGAGIGEPYVSHDIGSYMLAHLPDDLYARWVQLGAFQPILRLHSDHGDRLPWSYDAAADASAEKFLRLRESMVPYTYTLARNAVQTGVPIVEGLYLDYPEYPDAYTNTSEYLYGDNVLVAPVTSSDAPTVDDSAQQSVWFPPGAWTDYFTGQTFTGPSTQTLSVPIDQMPVFIKAGGIMPMRSNYVDYVNQAPLDQVTLNVAAGANGDFSLYEDAGQGLGYQSGQYATTDINYAEGGHVTSGANTSPVSTLTIGAQQGSYTGQVASRAWTLRLSDVVQPEAVAINGVNVGLTTSGTGYSYDAASQTLTVRTASLSTASPTVIALTGAQTATTVPANLAVPSTLSLSLGSFAPNGLGAFTPGLAATYSATLGASVITTGNDATLSVSDPSPTATGHLVNGAYSLAQALQADATSPIGSGRPFAAVGGSANPTTLLTYSRPATNDAVTIGFAQPVAATDPLRTGAYSKTLTFTLSTTTP